MSNGVTVDFEQELWKMADKLRNNMDAAEYKHVVLGIIFLKYISDAFEETRMEIAKDEYADVNDRDEYLARNTFWVPEKARWQLLSDNARSIDKIGQLVDDAMVLIEKENPSLKGVLPKNYGRQELDKRALGEIITMVTNIQVGNGHGRKEDVLGRVYEYFLSEFAAAEGKKGGQFYTPRYIVELLVQMIQPYKGRVYDPCCGSGGMFVQSEKFVEAHQGRIGDIAIYGQESNPTTWRLCKMNLAIRGIDGNLGDRHADTFHEDLHKGVKVDFVLANPPFNSSDWGGERLSEDPRWKYGVPPVGNANYAWIQHFINKLAPNGVAGFVLANGSMSTSTTAELSIRKGILESDLVDCIVALPGQLFYSTQIPVCLWFLARNKKTHTGCRDRSGETLFIDARELGEMEDRVHKRLTPGDIAKIAGTYHAWRGQTGEAEYKDTAGFCKAATLEDIAKQDYILTPGRYVGMAEVEDDGEPFEEKMDRLTDELAGMFEKSHELEAEIRARLGAIGYEL